MQKLIDPRLTQATTAPELEEAILGAMIMERPAAQMVVEKYPVNIFFKHRVLASIIYEMVHDGQAVDLLTLVQACVSKGEKVTALYNPYTITDLTNRVSSSANIDYHAKLLYQKAMASAMMGTLQEALNSILNQEDIFDVIDKVQQSVGQLQPVNNASTVKFSDISVLKTLVETLDKGFECFNTPWRTINKDFIGAEKCELIIVAAEPSVGKTAYVLNWLAWLCNNGEPVGLFVLESGVFNLKRRMVSAQAGINSMKIKTAQGVTGADLDNVAVTEKTLDEWPLYLNDKGHNAKAIERGIRDMHKLGVNFFIIDNLSNVKLEAASRHDIAIGDFLKVLTRLKMELNICIVLVVHLNRDQGGSRRPNNKRLRNSGELEQDADGIVFLWKEDDDELNQNIRVTCTKRRDGRLFDASLRFDKEQQTFFDLDDYEFVEGEDPF